MNEQRDFKGVWIPKEIWLDTRLNATEKIILIEIDSLSNEEKGCYASNEYLANFCQCSERKVSEAISKLIKCEYIYVESFNGRTRILRSKLSNYARQTSKNCEAESQKMQANNKSIINNNILEENIKRIFSFWNEQKIIVHTKISAEIKENIKKALNKYSLDEIETAILHYSMALKSTYKYCEYTWSLTQFLKQKNALQDFLDDGSKWINYLKWKNEYQVENKPDKVYDEFLKDDLGDD